MLSGDPKHDPLARWLADRDEASLAGARAEEIAASAEALVDRAARAHPDIDADRLVGAGFALVRAGHADRAGTAVVEWLLRDPSPARLDIASLLLSGIWVRGSAGPRVQPAHVEGLIAARRRAAFDETANAAALLALAATLPGQLPGPLRAQVLDELREAAADPRASRELREHLGRLAAAG